MGERLYQETLQTLGAAVRSFRRLMGISQEELADRSGLHRTYITDIERGARNMTVESMAKLAAALRVPMTELFIPPATDNRELLLPPPVRSKSRSGRAVHILLIEDSMKDAELTLFALEKNGVANRVSHVQTGEEAIDLLLGLPSRPVKRPAPAYPDLLLLDLSLPGMSGIAILRKVRASESTRSLPVIILTASRSDQDLKACLELGVSAYITKPVDFLEFSAAMPKLGLRWVLTEPRSRRRTHRPPSVLDAEKD
jgi:CheY-like chemotaxis protein/DNA-binding XRE family transcriptional regulator